MTTARRQLTVALGRTPGQPDLPAIAAEATALHARRPAFRCSPTRTPTIGAVTAALAEATWAHVACHASIVPNTPSAGGLHLYDGMLPVAEVGRRELPEAELTYLCACSTADGAAQALREVVHKLRTKHRTQPHLWVVLIHSGP